MGPFWSHGDFTINNIRHIGIVEGDAVMVLGCGEARIQMPEVVGGFSLVSILTVVDWTLVRVFGIALEKERYR